MTKKLPTLWTSHLKDETDKQKFREYILNSTSLWERLKDIAKDKKDNSSVSDYNNASWAYFQADRNGYNRALNEIIAILPVANSSD